MFHINTIFHQMISLDDTILEWEYYIFHAYTIWHYLDTGFDDILCKYNRGLVLFAARNCQPCHNFFCFLDISVFDIFYQFQHFVDIFFLIFYFNFKIFLYLYFWYACCILGFSWYSRYLSFLYCFIDYFYWLLHIFSSLDHYDIFFF